MRKKNSKLFHLHHIINRKDIDYVHSVESSADLLQVVKKLEYGTRDSGFYPSTFDVFKLNFDTMKWNQVNDLGGILYSWVTMLYSWDIIYLFLYLQKTSMNVNKIASTLFVSSTRTIQKIQIGMLYSL